MFPAIFYLLFVTFVNGASVGPERVIAGAPAPVDRFPYIVSILYSPTENVFVQTCGGSILTTTAILSAANCYEDLGRPKPASLYRARVGSAYASSGGTVYSLRQVTSHPNYDFRTRRADIAILRTTTTITYSATVRPISIAGANYNVSESDNLFIMGWGETFNTAENRDVLRYGLVNVVSQSYCKSLLGYEGITISVEMLCTGGVATGKRDFCQDYGSPVVNSRDLVQVGIASFSYRCGDYRYPSFSTRISNFTSWIVNTSK